MKLDIQYLQAAYDGLSVLKDLCLQVQAGEFISLLGPSGCGKTTLLKAIAGILPPTGGTVCLDGRDITHLPVHKRGTVVVFQDMRLFPHKTVLDNVAFPLKMQGADKASRRAAAAELLKKVQLEGLEDRLPAALSGGQQQRCALARALAAKPSLLLLDEAFSALDENLREEMRSLVRQLHREFGMTTVLVTHDREEALSLSDRVAMLFDGRIHQFDTPQTVYRRPATRAVADYFGDCLYLPGTVSAGVFRSQTLSLDVSLPDGAYDLLLRPGDLHPEQAGGCTVTVESLSFRGSDTLATLRGPEGLLWKKSLPGACPWQPGQQVKCSLRPETPVFFPEE